MKYGKWWWARRITAVAILSIFVISAYFKRKLLVGDYSGSTLLGVIPLTDPLMAAQSFLATGGLYKTAALGSAVVIVFYLLAGGRAFCGWVCPLGVLLDFAHWLSRKLSIRKPFQGFPVETKYYFMAATLAAALASGVALYEMYNPVSILARAILFAGLGAGLASWLVIGALFHYELAVARTGWCRSLCPLGAFLAILGRYSLAQVAATGGREMDIRNYVEVCPEPHALKLILNKERPSGECVMCGACVDRAADGAIRFGIRKFRK
ncbi:MAG: quinol dehydrogenase ferredoxin subunit NapH [Nitrospinae bacterium]|nr:quinol dehydrogenase ferredoxin subunit NapH [Nitrospinota bacterium]